MWDNVETSMMHNFDKQARTYAFPKYPYDFMSIMQYSLDSFAKDKSKPTMVLTVTNFHPFITIFFIY